MKWPKWPKVVQVVQVCFLLRHFLRHFSGGTEKTGAEQVVHPIGKKKLRHFSACFASSFLFKPLLHWLRHFFAPVWRTASALACHTFWAPGGSGGSGAEVAT